MDEYCLIPKNPPPIKEFDHKEVAIARIRDLNADSPIKLHYKDCKIIKLPDLEWKNYDKIPTKCMVTNNGRTVIMSAAWKKNENPIISGGPLNGNYILSRIIFHWGKKANFGSIHTIDDKRLALEVQLIYFREEYKSLEKAQSHTDGVVIFVYLYEIRFCMNTGIERITTVLPKLRGHNSFIYIDGFAMRDMFPIFKQEYFTYFGVVKSCVSNCVHHVQWIISRVMLPVSFYQMKLFSPLFTNKLTIIEDFWRRVVDSARKATVLLVSRRIKEDIFSSWTTQVSQDNKEKSYCDCMKL